jgi:putative SOS response-associated peptidase YedK
MRWDLIPGWWKKTAKDMPSTFNARAETVAQKPMFRSAFERTLHCAGVRLLRMAASKSRVH